MQVPFFVQQHRLCVLTKMSVIIPGSIGKYRRIHKLSATGAFPSIKRTDKIIKLLYEHSAFTSWTVHNFPRLSVFYQDKRS
jgi:hypothetical protein